MEAGLLCMSCTKYNDFLETLLAAIHMNPQGRPHAIESMLFKTFMKFWESKRAVSSSSFKTSATFGYQVITIEGIAHELMTTYLDIVRPRVEEIRKMKGIDGCKRGSSENDNVFMFLIQFCYFTEFLFQSFNGKGCCRVARFVSQFFWKHMRLFMNPTSLRTLVECTIREGISDGVITEAEAVAVNRTLGHSKSVADRFYRLDNRYVWPCRT